MRIVIPEPLEIVEENFNYPDFLKQANYEFEHFEAKAEDFEKFEKVIEKKEEQSQQYEINPILRLLDEDYLDKTFALGEKYGENLTHGKTEDICTEPMKQIALKYLQDKALAEKYNKENPDKPLKTLAELKDLSKSTRIADYLAGNLKPGLLHLEDLDFLVNNYNNEKIKELNELFVREIKIDLDEIPDYATLNDIYLKNKQAKESQNDFSKQRAKK